MTTIYKEFENNSEVMDVLFCIIDGKKDVKSIIKILKQPQSTVSTKLQFLRENDIVVKNKWKYEPNWKIIKRMFQSEIRKIFVDLLDFFRDSSQLEKDKIGMIRGMIKRIPEIFNEKRVINIYEMYADYSDEGLLKRINTSGLAKLYIEMLKKTDTTRFKDFDEDIISIKSLFNKLGIRNMEEDFFIQVERNIKS